MTSGAGNAIARKKLRVHWDAQDPPSAPAHDAVIDGLYAALRQQHAAPGNSQDEQLEICAMTPGADSGTFNVVFRYVFDNDYASQYDQTEKFDGEVVVDGQGALVTIARWVSQSAS